MSTHFDDHLDALQMQAYLDGELPAGERGEVRSHLEECPRCRAEVEAWDGLFHELEELPVLSPSPVFRERILESVQRPAARRAGVRSVLGRSTAKAGSDHVAPGRLQDFLEGALAARSAAKVESHLADCAVCRDELAAFREVGIALSSLPRLAPSPDFGERVMASLRVQQMAQLAMSPTGRLERFAAAARRWAGARLPSSRQGWAAAMGMALAPAVVVALVVQAVFAHPLVTPSNLISFVALQLRGLAAGASALLTNPVVASVLEAGRPVFDSPALLAAVVTGLSGLTVAASWTLYRNVFSTNPAEVSHVRAAR